MDAGLSRGRARGVRAALRGGPDLPRRLHRQLVPALPDRAVRPRGGARGAGRRVRLHQVRAADARHRAPGDEAGRHRAWPCNPKDERYAKYVGKDARDPVGRRARSDAGRRRRGGGPGVRHRASSRSRPATIRPTSRSAGATACRSGTVIGFDGKMTAARRQVRGARPLRGAEAHRRGHAGARAHRADRALPARGRPLLPLQDRGRAAGLQAVVRAHEAAGRARRQGGPRTAASRSCRGAGRRPTTTGWRTSATGASRASSGGATASRSGTATRTGSIHVSRERPDRVPELRRPAPPGPRRARHVVLARALAVLDARLARRHAGAQDVLSDRRCW